MFKKKELKMENPYITLAKLFDNIDIILDGVNYEMKLKELVYTHDEEERLRWAHEYYSEVGIHWEVLRATFIVAKNYFDKPFSGITKQVGSFYIKKAQWEDLKKNNVVMIIRGMTLTPETILEMKLMNKIPTLPRQFRYKTLIMVYGEMDLRISIAMGKYSNVPRVEVEFPAHILVTPDITPVEIELLPENKEYYNYLELLGLTFEEVT